MYVKTMVTVNASLQASRKIPFLRAWGFFPFELFISLLCRNFGLVVSWFAFLPRRFPPWLKSFCTSLFLSWFIAWNSVKSSSMQWVLLLPCWAYASRPYGDGTRREHNSWANPLTGNIWMARARLLETVSVRSLLEPLKFVFMLPAVCF